jgi:hypothetical protein
MTTHDEQVDLLHADRHRDGSLVSRLAEAETELHELSELVKTAYREYRTLDDRQTAKANEVKELRLQIREAANGDQ